MSALDSDVVAGIVDDQEHAYGLTEPTEGVLTVTGAGVRITVHRGHLELQDGIGPTRRTRRLPRVAHGVDRLVVEARNGYVTLDALNWCKAAGVTVVGVGTDRTPAWGSFPSGARDARVTRALALAGSSDTHPLGVQIVTRLLERKLTGQAQVVADRLDRADLAATITDLAGTLPAVRTVSDARQVEAVAASLYWAAWGAAGPATTPTVPRLRPSDAAKVPVAWRTFPGRRSLLGAGAANRRASHPTNSLLNFCHTLARVEASLALLRLGVDPSLGILHDDTPRRDSLACDLQETIRPLVEGFVLDLLAARTFRRADFLESPDGEVRLGVGLRQELAASMSRWEEAVAVEAEALRAMLARSVATGGPDGLGTSRAITAMSAPLSGTRRREAAAVVAARKRAASEASRLMRAAQQPPDSQERLSLFSCVNCGAAVTNARHTRCEQCIAADPRQTPELRQSRARAISARRQAEAGWSAHHPAGGGVDPAWWDRVCRPALASAKVSEIMAAAGVSKSTASGWRSGKHVPHPSHWETLADLAEVPRPLPATTITLDGDGDGDGNWRTVHEPAATERPHTKKKVNR